MKELLAVAAVLALALFGGREASARILIYEQDYSYSDQVVGGQLGHTHYAEERRFSFPQLDPSTGTLTNATVGFHNTGWGSRTLAWDNEADYPQTYNLTFFSKHQVLAPNCAFYTYGQPTQTHELPPDNDVTADFVGADSFVQNKPAGGPGGLAAMPAGWLASYQGTGEVAAALVKVHQSQSEPALDRVATRFDHTGWEEGTFSLKYEYIPTLDRQAAVTLGNDAWRGGGHDSWRNNLIIDLNNTYTNSSGDGELLRVDSFEFLAGTDQLGHDNQMRHVTPFLVKVTNSPANSLDDFLVVAVGKTRSGKQYWGPDWTRTGTFLAPFDDTEPTFELADGETIAAGFLDADPDGQNNNGGVVSAVGGGSTWYTASTGDGSISGTVAVGSPPTEAFHELHHVNALFDRTYAFNIGLSVVPEPSTLILLAMGAVGLVGYVWRRRQRK